MTDTDRIAELRALHDDYDDDGHCDECGERRPCTVRALCDAADEVDRLRGDRDALRTLRMEINQGFGGPATIKVWRDNVLRFNGVDLSALMERDASRTAHAALVAELRALRSRSGYVLAADVLALLDRHAPTTGATP